MKIKSFYVENYRSIKSARIDDLQNFCVITGPNNAGKSNLLRALNLALALCCRDFSQVYRRKYLSYTNSNGYIWEQDIPYDLKTDENASTKLELALTLSENDIKELCVKTGENVSQCLRIHYILSKKDLKFKIIGEDNIEKTNQNEIFDFIQNNIAFEYIPCIRSSEFSADYFTRLINNELKQLENNAEYKECIDKIENLQKPILQELENKITKSLQVFLPSVKSVSLDDTYSNKLGNQNYLSVWRSRAMPLNVDDGVKTSIDYKGEGIKSLAAISIIQSITFEKAGGRQLILIIEEPESHLHSDAIHSLRNVIQEIVLKGDIQVLISTHSPILIDRDNVKHNIIVENNHAIKSCENIEEIRKALGVRTLDALLPEKVIIVEGENDRRYIETLCKEFSPELERKIKAKEIEVKSAGSCSKIDNLIRYYNTIMVPTFAVFDSDSAGISEYHKILDCKLKNTDEIAIIKSAGLKEAELEDIVDFNVYFDQISKDFNINLNVECFKKRKKPWSDRLKKAAEKSAGVFDDTIESKIKSTLAEIVEKNGFKAIAKYDMDYMNNLIASINTFVNK